MLEVTSPDGTKRRQIFPAGRAFTQGEVVGWDWDLKSKFGPAYYHDPETGICREAWAGSLAFIGRPNPPQSNVSEA
jgi:hypothetical protein